MGFPIATSRRAPADNHGGGFNKSNLSGRGQQQQLRGSSFWTATGPTNDDAATIQARMSETRISIKSSSSKAAATFGSDCDSQSAVASLSTQVLVRALQAAETKNRVMARSSSQHGIHVVVMQRNVWQALHAAAKIAAEEERARQRQEQQRFSRPLSSTTTTIFAGVDGDDDDDDSNLLDELPRSYSHAQSVFDYEYLQQQHEDEDEDEYDSTLYASHSLTPIGSAGTEAAVVSAPAPTTTMDVDSRKDSFAVTIEVIPLPARKAQVQAPVASAVSALTTLAKTATSALGRISTCTTNSQSVIGSRSASPWSVAAADALGPSFSFSGSGSGSVQTSTVALPCGSAGADESFTSLAKKARLFEDCTVA